VLGLDVLFAAYIRRNPDYVDLLVSDPARSDGRVAGAQRRHARQAVRGQQSRS